MALPEPTTPSPDRHWHPHPRLTFVLLVLLLLVCVENAATTYLSIQQARDLPQLATILPPIYLAIVSAWWAMAFAACIVGVVAQTQWASWATVATAVLYEANLWINRLAFAQASEVYATLGFRALLTIIFLGLVSGLVVLSQPAYNRRHARPNT